MTLFELEESWKSYASKHADAGREAIGGFLLQTHVSLKKFFEKGPPFNASAFDSLSDFAEENKGQIVTIQVKKTLTGATFRKAMEEAELIDRFLADEFPQVRNDFRFQVVTKKIDYKDFKEDWIPLDLRGRVLDPMEDSQPFIDVTNSLYGQVKQPTIFIDLCVSQLLELMSNKRSAVDIQTNLMRLWDQHVVVRETVSYPSVKVSLIPSNVPPLASHIIQRNELVNRVRNELSAKSTMSVYGGSTHVFAEGGYGKSVLAAMYAVKHRGDYPGGMYQLACENSELDDLLAGLLSPESEDFLRMGNPERAHHVVILLREKASLLILDNITDIVQWTRYKDSGYLNQSNVDVLVTTRADDLDLDGIPVEALTLEETIELLAKFAPSASQGEHRAAIDAIHRETEGLAVAIAAVGAAMRFQRKDNNWAAYAEWLAKASAEELPENSAYTGYKSSIIAVLRDLQTNLHPAQKRALEYAALLPPDEIKEEWLHVLLHKEAETGQVHLGNPAPGTPPTDWHLRQLRDHGLLRQNETGLWSVHRLHRKIALSEGFESDRLLENLWNLGSFYWSQGAEYYSKSHFFSALQSHDSNLALFSAVFLQIGEKATADQSNALASAYSNRGILHGNAQNFTAAIRDHGMAIKVQETLRDSLGDRWSAGFQNGLASAYMNRGSTHQEMQNFPAAMSDYDQAIKVRETLRDSLGDQWSAEFQNGLANAYMNRGIAHKNVQNFLASISDYDLAIKVQENLRESQGDQWSAEFQNGLARAYMNRGVVHRNMQNFPGAISDYGMAIKVQETLRDSLGDQWSAGFQNVLATGYMNRGVAHQNMHNFTAAISDYDQAIKVRETLRDSLGDQWSAGFQNDLATAYMNRGVANSSIQNFATSLSDYGMAINVQEALRDSLGDKWHKALGADLAKTLRNRALVYGEMERPDLALADLQMAGEIDAIE